LVSFTLVPWLTSRFGKVHKFSEDNFLGKIILNFERGIDWFTDGFVTALRWALKNSMTKVLTIAVALGLFFSSFLLIKYGYVGNAFFDPGDRGEFLVGVELPKDASLAQTDKITKEVETWLLKNPEVVNTFTTVGTNNKSFGLNAGFVSEILVYLRPLEERSISTDIFARKAKVALEETISGAKIRTSPIDILGLSFSPIEIFVNGPNLDSLLILSKKIEQTMATVPGCVEIAPSVEGGNPEVSILSDRKKMADYGLTMAQIGLTLQTAFSGNTDAKYRAGDYEYPIRIELDAFNRRNIADIKRLSFVNPLGNSVYLEQFAEVKENTAPNRLERRDRLPSLLITAQVIGRPNGSVSRDIKAKLDSIQMPTGTYIKYGGDLKRQNQGLGTMGFALWTSLLLVYLIMVALYDNWVYPLVVLISIPLSLIGALLALALSSENLTIFTGMGLLMLIGLVAKNAILVVDFATQLRNQGVEIKEALLTSTKLRFRPVLMTNIAMIIGLLPIATAVGAGSQWKNGLAWAIIGGLNSSMFLSLIVVPVVYWLFDRGLVLLGLDKKKKIELEE
jgi:hydrophobic/amphiphilic exporter-1 (mainly G- bacteria), HAE1 family